MVAPLVLDRYDALIFDLGGVILSLYPERTVAALSELLATDASLAYTQTKQTELFDRFERGEMEKTAFHDAIRTSWDASGRMRTQDFDEAWNAMLGDVPTAHLEFLSALREEKRVFLLSNTNEIHIERFLLDYEARHEAEFGKWEALFEAAHYSHELGMRKPEPRIYHELIRRHGLEPTRTLFLDDNQANVLAAKAAGLAAELHPTNAPLHERFAFTPGARNS